LTNKIKYNNNKVVKNPIALRIFLVGTIALFFAIVPIFNKTFASNIIFQDNFDQDANGSFPSKWDLYPIANTCPDQWKVDNGILKISINNYNSCTTNIIPKKTLWSNSENNYEFSLDVTFVSGTDHNIVYRTDPSVGVGWELHFQSPGGLSFAAPSGTYNVNVPGTYYNGNTYHITIIENGRDIQIFIDNTLIIDYVFSSDMPQGGIALRAGVGGNPSSETWFDNIKVTTLDPDGIPTPTPTPTAAPTPTSTPTPTPTTTPTPIPTVTPTPTPPSVKLNVPVLRQTDKPWNTQIYDGANFWSPLSKTINSWGCALTSYTMVLKYFGINKLPNGTILDPGTLNTWLKSNNGYIDGKNSGYLNPLAISSLSKQAVKINKITSFDALEYSRLTSTNTLPLINELSNNRPAILEEPGHYIVTTGITTHSFSIIDPYYSNRTDLSYYSNTFISLNRLTPSKTDLSYILVATNQNVNIQIKDFTGNIIGNQFLQQPLANDDNNKPSGEALKMEYVQKPLSGDYQISLISSSNETISANLYSYDVNGNLTTDEIPIVLSSGKSNLINLNFDNQNANNSSVEKIVTFDSLISDIRTLNNLHLINARSADELIKSIMKLQKNYNKKFKILTKIELRFMKESLRFYDKKLINQDAREIIERDINDLIRSL
jgi:hypothetical protein